MGTPDRWFATLASSTHPRFDHRMLFSPFPIPQLDSIAFMDRSTYHSIEFEPILCPIDFDLTQLTTLHEYACGVWDLDSAQCSVENARYLFAPLTATFLEAFKKGGDRSWLRLSTSIVGGISWDGMKHGTAQ